MKAIWINNILYEHQDKVLNHYNLEPADEYVKKVFPDAVYMERREDWTHVFIPHQGLLEANSFTYKIDANGMIHGALVNIVSWLNFMKKIKRDTDMSR